MKFTISCFIYGVLSCIQSVLIQALALNADIPSTSLSILATTSNVEADKVAFYHDKEPILIGNDGSAHLGGFHVFSPSDKSEGKIPELYSKITGRTKVVTTVYSVGKEDYLVTFSTPEHLLRLYQLPSGKEIVNAQRFILAEFSAVCGWRSPITNAQYIYLFGKKEVKIFLVRQRSEAVEVVEVTSFVLPIGAETCAIPTGESIVLFGGSNKKLYTFAASDLPTTPPITVVAETDDEIVGAAVYHSTNGNYYYFIAFEEAILVYSRSFQVIGSIIIDAGEGLELSDIAIFQGASNNAKEGLLAYALESDEYGKGFGVSSLSPVFSDVKIKANTNWNPKPNSSSTKFPACSIIKNCNTSGLCTSKTTCACYTGSTGSDCSQITCLDNCSGNGKCASPNVCKCRSPYTGPSCSVLSVLPKYETEAGGADGDDPAIWITAENDKSQSRVITTTKSEDNPGLSVFDLRGKKQQFLAAEEPNNVDIIYSFPFGDKGEKIDLAYAGCRGDNTLCLFKIDPTGLMSNIAGGSQPLVEDFKIYGTCAYHRHRDNRFFLFANSKEAIYLQYELTSFNNTLKTNLVRQFKIGTGTQPEGCVVDDENEVIFIGEEQIGMWKYDANPELVAGSGVLVDSVDKMAKGRMDADVEGITLVYGKTKSDGFLIVSMQGVSGYNVYKRKAPHDFILRFSIVDNTKAGVDKVTNTDGIAAVGTALGRTFGKGLVVVHDDANELKEGGTDENASFKFVGLGDILQEGFDKQIDHEWDPRYQK